MTVLTSTNIVSSVKRMFSVPDAEQLLTEAEILAFCNEELLSIICPEIEKLRGDYFTTQKDVSTVAGTGRYRLPERALARGVRELKLKLSDGSERNLVEVKLDQKHIYHTTSRAQPEAFYLMGDYINLLPIPDAVYTLEVFYDQRPSELVPVSDTAFISAVSPSTYTLTLSATLSGLSSSTPIDIVSGKAGNNTLAIDVSPTSVSSVTVILDAATYPSEVAAGDYLCFAKETPLVPIPEECLPALIQAVGNRCMMALGDIEAYSQGEARLNKLLSSMRDLLSPRSRGESPIAVNQHFVGFSRRRSTYAKD